jgi:hypothetical protein
VIQALDRRPRPRPTGGAPRPPRGPEPCPAAARGGPLPAKPPYGRGRQSHRTHRSLRGSGRPTYRGSCGAANTLRPALERSRVVY